MGFIKRDSPQTLEFPSDVTPWYFVFFHVQKVLKDKEKLNFKPFCLVTLRNKNRVHVHKKDQGRELLPRKVVILVGYTFCIT